MTLLSLAACEQSANPPTQPKTPVAQVQPAKPPAEKQPSEKLPATVSRSATAPEPAPEPAAVDKPQSSVQDKPSAPEPEPEPAAALDLSLHPNVFDPLQPLEPINDLSTPLLPPLFGEKVQPDSPFQLNGKLITNERDEDYWQSVEGAQLQFEFKH
ncbi:MAG: hypothetical protein KKH62_03445 [Gammaproteobacteria bacterium]|nr:hypothetical protein [Gammaproteobacteria bacterium]